jgi:RNA polymerase sigma-70 factor (ECF subfamily)
LDFAQAYDDHVWYVYGYFAYRLGSRADAEDLTQLTFERALKAWDRFDERRAAVGTWLLSIARNLLIDHYRRNGTRAAESLYGDGLPEVALPVVPGPEDAGVGLSAELAEALAELTARERELIALRFGADMSGAEIAKLLDLSLANVHQILSRSLRKMRSTIEAGSAQGAPVVRQ